MNDFNSDRRRWNSKQWSLAVATLWGVPIRVHVSLVILLLAIMLAWFSVYGVAIALMLLAALVLHELGHALVSQWLGGRVDEIVLWPIGGLPSGRLPHRRWESLLVFTSGPAFNALACVFLLPIVEMCGGITWTLWNPFSTGIQASNSLDPRQLPALAFKVNYWLLLLNAMPLYPLDAARAFREVLSMRMSGLQANLLTLVLGIGGGLVFAGVGLWFNNVWIAAAGSLIAVISFKRHREIELLGESADNEFGYDFSEGYTSLERSMTHAQGEHSQSKGVSIKNWLEDRKRRHGEFLEAELDRILTKIHDHGMKSLSRNERRILDEVSRRRRQ